MVLGPVLSGLLLTATLLTSAHASPILMNSWGNPSDIPKPLASIPGAESFVATSTGIGDVMVALSSSGTTSGSVLITVMSDNVSPTNKPSGIVLDTIATLNESSIGTGEGLYDFYNLPIDNLTIGARYWVNVGKTGIPAVSTNIYTSTAAPSVGVANLTLATGNTSYYPGGGNGKISPLMVSCISTDNSCDATNTSFALSVNEAVPEPASIAVLGTSLIGLGWLRRRKC